MVMRPAGPRKFFSQSEKEIILQAIREAESKTSGEIRVYLEERAKGEALDRARRIFEKLGMTRTKLRNGVLFYFSLADHTFSVLGDRGIYDRVGQDFWRSVVQRMEGFFSQDDFAGGLAAGIRWVGESLSQWFPRQAGDLNELSDEIEGSSG